MTRCRAHALPPSPRPLLRQRPDACGPAASRCDAGRPVADCAIRRRRLRRRRRRRRARQEGPPGHQPHRERLRDSRGQRPPAGRRLRALHASRRAETASKPPRRLASDRRAKQACVACPKAHRSSRWRGTGWSPKDAQSRYKAARRLVETKAPGELVGVFLTDMTLRTIEPYTTDSADGCPSRSRETGDDGDLVDDARDRVLSTASSAARIDARDGQRRRGGQHAGRISQTSVVVRPTGTETIIAMLERMERTYQAHLYEAQGRASMLGLFALVDSLGQLPGRKTVFYFCEGLTITESQQAGFARSSTPPTGTTSASTRSTRPACVSTAHSSRPLARCAN